MPAGLLLAAALLGQTAETSAPAPASAPPASTASTGRRECTPTVPDPNTREIVVCAIKPEGYRIDPDVLKARREARNHTHPQRPNDFADHSCRVVGPAPCIDAPMINLLAAAATLAEISDRLSKGQEIGSIFVTDPQPTEYQLYLDAKKEREAAEAEKAAKARAKAAAVQPAAHPSQ
jgi:hypothetical protein